MRREVVSEVARKMRSHGLLVFRTKLARERLNNKELPPIHLIVFIGDKPIFVRIARQNLKANKFQVRQVPELPGDYVILDPSVFGLERFFEYVELVRRERIVEKIKEDWVEELRKIGLI
ncbi:MAG: hypothetical protein QXJ23_10020 [Thermofilum sp.]|uniref:hypothetical protein n=1 Tax=Thermofilum sp. TaxID=1961369 RepID=UPI00317BDE78